MIQRILLILDGLRVPDESRCEKGPYDTDESYLHPSEAAIQEEIVQFGTLHCEIADGVDYIRNSYLPDSGISSRRGINWRNSFKENPTSFKGLYSLSAHAVAEVILCEVLNPFRKFILDIEAKVLDRESSYVGRDTVISLSLIYSQTVRVWKRRFEFCQHILRYLMFCGKMQPRCHEIIALLSDTSLTGYPDVKELSEQLLSQVENVWLSQLRSWVVYGRLKGLSDDEEFEDDSNTFMITRSYKKDGSTNGYVMNENYVPRIISNETAKDIYTIGHCISRLELFSERRFGGTKELEIVERHVSLLDTVQVPIQPAQFHRVITALKKSVFLNTVATALPISSIEKLIQMVRRLVLLGSSEFVSSFLDAVDQEGKPRNMNSINSEGLLRRAISSFCEDTSSQNDQKLLELATGSMRWIILSDKHQIARDDKFDDLLLGKRAKLVLSLDWQHEILINTNYATGLGHLFSYFAAIAKIRREVKSLWYLRRGRDAITVPHSAWSLATYVNLFLDNLWDYIQSIAVDTKFEDIKRGLESDAGDMDLDRIIGVIQLCIKNIEHSSFYSNVGMRKTLRHILQKTSALVSMMQRSSDITDNVLQLPALIRQYYETAETTADDITEVKYLLMRSGDVLNAILDGAA